MTQQRRRQDGVRALADILDRCWVNPATGCWEWRYAFNDTGMPVCMLAAGALSPGRKAMAAQRAAWLFSGGEAIAGRVVYRTCGCMACVNPAHVEQGTHAAMHALRVKRTGTSPGSLTALRVAQGLRTTPPEKVVRVADTIDGGASAEQAAQEHGLHVQTVRLIANRQHVHQRGGVLASTGVFSGGPA